MKTKILSLFFLSIIILQVNAQTKLIAHKSHGGSEADFQLALEQHLLDIDGSNYGLAPDPLLVEVQLDSLIFVNDTTSIVVTSLFSKLGHESEAVQVLSGDGQTPKFNRDTVYNHPDLTAKLPISDVKKRINLMSNYRNPADSVKILRLEHGNYVPVEDEENEIIVPGAPVPPSGGINQSLLLRWSWLVVLLMAVTVSLLAKHYERSGAASRIKA